MLCATDGEIGDRKCMRYIRMLLLVLTWTCSVFYLVTMLPLAQPDMAQSQPSASSAVEYVANLDANLEPKTVIFMPTIQRNGGRKSRYLDRSIVAVTDQVTEIERIRPGTFRVIIVNTNRPASNHSAFYRLKQHFESDVVNFVEIDNATFPTPYSDPNAGVGTGSRYICGPQRRQQAIDFSNSIFGISQLYPSSDLLILEDDTELCDNALEALMIARLEVELISTPKPFGLIQISFGGSGILLHHSILAELSKYTADTITEANIDVSIWKYTDINELTGFVSQHARAKHIGLISAFNLAKHGVAEWRDTKCDAPMRMDWGLYDSCDEKWKGLAQLGFNCTKKFTFGKEENHRYKFGYVDNK